MISINNLSVEFSAKALFENISYVINPRDKIALVGKNGAGKSTMLKIIAGLQSPTGGSVSMPSDLTIGYLPQQMQVSNTLSLIDETRKAFSHVKEMNQRLHDLTEQLSQRTDYESEEYHALIDRMTTLSDQVQMLNADNYEAEIEKTLIGLGFKRSDFARHTSEFSGGWRMRIELAKLLLSRPDVLLLDEPTNHLDIESIQWLENFLISKAKAVVLVSHDRAFIDNVTSRTIEISLGKIYDYNVNYSHFVELRDQRIEQQKRAYANQQKQIQDTEQFIERFRYKATKAVQVQSRMKQLAKIERIEIDEVDNSRLNLKFPPAARSGDYPVIAENVGKAYGDHQVFDNASFVIKRGEKVAFVGKNGEGKSTMVKCIMDEIPFTGNLKIGHNIKIGYFAQNQAQLLDEDLTVFETIDNVAVGDIRTKIRDMLGAFLFGGEDIDKKVKVLSGGEKTRLALLKLLLEPVNLLILDEPTNHLDMRTKDILKQAIIDFNGTAIIVSHDRQFLDGLVEKVYEFGEGQVKECLGGIYEFLEKKKLQSLEELQLAPSSAKSKETPKDNPDKDIVTSPKQLSYAEQKERERQLRKLKKNVEIAENSIAKLEEEKQEIEDKFAIGETSASLFQRHVQLMKEIDQCMEAWEQAQNEYDELANS